MSYYNSYQSDSRRNSNSFSEELGGAKRKRRSWGKRRGGVSGNRGNITVDTPLFKEPNAPPARSPVNLGRQSRGAQRENPFRSPDLHGRGGPQPYFDIRDMPNFVEPQHSGTSWQWETFFHDCKAWQDKHKLAYYRSRCLALEFENKMLFDQIGLLTEENCVLAAERGQLPTMRLPELPGRQGLQTERGGQASNFQSSPKKQGKNQQASPSTDSEITFEVSEDMMAFLEKSIRHKLSLKKKKNQGDAKVKNENDIKKDKQGPKTPASVKRKEELDLLYGNNSAVIHGLETSIQLNFNRNCDTYKPELYPAVPINSNCFVAE